jgi:hypothetical protein
MAAAHEPVAYLAATAADPPGEDSGLMALARIGALVMLGRAELDKSFRNSYVASARDSDALTILESPQGTAPGSQLLGQLAIADLPYLDARRTGRSRSLITSRGQWQRARSCRLCSQRSSYWRISSRSRA